MQNIEEGAIHGQSQRWMVGVSHPPPPPHPELDEAWARRT